MGSKCSRHNAKKYVHFKNFLVTFNSQLKTHSRIRLAIDCTRLESWLLTSSHCRQRSWSLPHQWGVWPTLSSTSNAPILSWEWRQIKRFHTLCALYLLLFLSLLFLLFFFCFFGFAQSRRLKIVLSKAWLQRLIIIIIIIIIVIIIFLIVVVVSTHITIANTQPYTHKTTILCCFTILKLLATLLVATYLIVTI